MNKEDMISALAQEAGMTKVSAEVALEAVLRIISDALVSGEKIQLVGFGTFESKERAARVGRNPKANTPVNIPAKRVPVFKPGSTLKLAVANSK